MIDQMKQNFVFCVLPPTQSNKQTGHQLFPWSRQLSHVMWFSDKCLVTQANRKSTYGTIAVNDAEISNDGPEFEMIGHGKFAKRQKVWS